MRAYDLIADWYASERVGTADGSVPEVEALASSIEPGSLILDVGCGNGVPLTRALLAAGHRVIGLDSAEAMLERFRTNCPLTPVVKAVVEACPFAPQTFDAALAWGVLFHLPQAAQVLALASVSRALKPGALFLFTAGYDVPDDDAHHVDTMNGVKFPYYSLTNDGYRRILTDQGFTLERFHLDAGSNGYYLARKTSPQTRR